MVFLASPSMMRTWRNPACKQKCHPRSTASISHAFGLRNPEKGTARAPKSISDKCSCTINTRQNIICSFAPSIFNLVNPSPGCCHLYRIGILSIRNPYGIYVYLSSMLMIYNYSCYNLIILHYRFSW